LWLLYRTHKLLWKIKKGDWFFKEILQTKSHLVIHNSCDNKA
jgi:hypothetical protein